MYVVGNGKRRGDFLEEELILSEWDMLSRPEQNRYRFDTYRRCSNLVDSLLSFDGEAEDKDEEIEKFFMTSGVDDEEKWDYMMDSLKSLEVPETLLEDFQDDDTAIVINAFEETREYLADTFLDEYEPVEVVDALYLVDHLKIWGNCSPASMVDRNGNIRKGIERHTKSADGKEKKYCSYELPEGTKPAIKSTALKGRKSGRKNHNPKSIIKEIDKSTEIQNDKNNNHQMDSIHGFLVDGKALDSRHEWVWKIVDNKKTKVKQLKAEHQGELKTPAARERSRKMKGKKTPDNILKKMAKSRERNIKKYGEDWNKY